MTAANFRVCASVAVMLALGACGERSSSSGDGETPVEPAPTPVEADGPKLDKDGNPAIHAPTGLVMARGYEAVVANCTACHAAKLVIQNRGTRADWEAMLRWMQASHNLWSLRPDTRDAILDYLAENYGIEEERDLRRQPLPRYLMPPTKAELAKLDQAAASGQPDGSGPDQPDVTPEPAGDAAGAAP